MSDILTAEQIGKLRGGVAAGRAFIEADTSQEVVMVLEGLDLACASHEALRAERDALREELVERRSDLTNAATAAGDAKYQIERLERELAEARAEIKRLKEKCGEPFEEWHGANEDWRKL